MWRTAVSPSWSSSARISRISDSAGRFSSNLTCWYLPPPFSVSGTSSSACHLPARLHVSNSRHQGDADGVSSWSGSWPRWRPDPAARAAASKRLARLPRPYAQTPCAQTLRVQRVSRGAFTSRVAYINAPRGVQSSTGALTRPGPEDGAAEVDQEGRARDGSCVRGLAARE